MRQWLSILVVDDEPSITSSLLWALRPLGHTVEGVNDGEQALSKITVDPSMGLVITDHSMPRMNGIELVRRLRGAGYEGKVIVLSAHLSQHNRTLYDSLGVNAMVPKPFDVDALRQVIAELFQDPATL
jgi:CheY-like chemotaxis protein